MRDMLRDRARLLMMQIGGVDPTSTWQEVDCGVVKSDNGAEYRVVIKAGPGIFQPTSLHLCKSEPSQVGLIDKYSEFVDLSSDHHDVEFNEALAVHEILEDLDAQQNQ